MLPRRAKSLLLLLALLLLVIVAAMTVAPTSSPGLHRAAKARRVRGMNLAHSMDEGKGYGSAASLGALHDLKAIGVDSIAITPFGFQRHSSDTEIFWVGHGGRGIDETDEALRGVTAQAHQLGISVMMKPHLWLRPPDWPGSIDHSSDAEWAAWFASYRPFILHYAQLSEQWKIETLVIGNELPRASKREREWRQLIAAIRRVYHGHLTYGANITEVFDVRFWDALDFIGVSAYFPLSDEASPSRDTLQRGWSPVVTRLERLAAKSGRTIVFTELGYRSCDYSADRPWEHEAGPVNLPLQRDAYDAFFRAVWPQRWFGGVYFWKWESHRDHSGPLNGDFPIEHKPAAEVVRRYFTVRESP